ncbi:hypothetical protein HG535_0F00680 [Zygotorulaspora mrakii]|uniref:S-adenosylmethionine decarboxylase proenzyme n=1 Tax=Zygotorulaspora mrakii TaxID=42260 RepID=A0A7H9B4E4_ZYGMR|nr:uncharacterized protein HG535_0F00680 [Zygotorulaspora mrakii]QLG73558.1 hypothetical protein HG535_0F00680 [Zygotorulaspora mrakii]
MTISIKELTNHSYIDHELSANLDSTEAFEGPEKLLEIWFYPNVQTIPRINGQKLTLRNIEVDKWVEILKLVKCEVLSIKSTGKLDAFLLSESSLFVYDHKITLKTCGTTTTLFCLERLFDIVKDELKWDLLNHTSDEGKYHPYKVFYSRRCFMFPLKQRSIHKNWSNEIEYLNNFFRQGRSYLVGRNDQSNHWNLYVTETNKEMAKDSEVNPDDDQDETLEILMTGLDNNKAQQFICSRNVKDDLGADEGHAYGYKITKNTQLDCVYQNRMGSSFHHDAFAFTPCGYSSNMIIDEEYYYTLHVTPEKGWSYASFESNVPVSTVSLHKQDNLQVMNSVLNAFQPQDFCLTFFAKDMSNQSFTKLMQIVSQVSNYTKKDRIIYDLDDYQLLYMRFERIVS